MAFADTNAFTITINSGVTPISFTGSIADINGTWGQAITPVDISGEFSGTQTPFTFAETGTTWPSWATLDPNTGIITGTPDAVGTTSGHTVTGTDADTNNAPSNTFQFIVAAVAPTVDAGGPYSGDADTVIQLAATVTPGSDPSPTLAWSVVSGPDLSAGQFSNTAIEDPTFTPSQVGSYTLRLSADPSDGSAVTDDATLTSSGGGPVPVAFNGTIPNRTTWIGAAFTLNVSTYFSGTETPFTYALTTGTLPDGLTLDTNTGVISGTPTTEELQSGISITATDTGLDTAVTNTFSINVLAEQPPSGSLTDAKFDALRGLGHTGSISDMTLAWLQSDVAVTAKTIPDAWDEWLADKLGINYTGNRSTDWFNYLRSLGYTGALNDMEFQFWVNL